MSADDLIGLTLPQDKCSLLPHQRREILSIQEAKQRSGWMITAFDLPHSWTNSEGEGVKIAVLDSGCDVNHPDLKENLLPGYNFFEPSKPPWDDNGHGTHVTGIMVAGNNDIGMVGVCPKSKVIPIKVLDKDGDGDLSVVALGILKAIELGADMISLSLGAPCPLPGLLDAINKAAAVGIPTFCAGGNAGESTEIYYPAAYKTTIAIGAIDEKFNRATFSNTGRNLDFMAPGVNILSTVPDNWYAIMSGTSMASPFVCGIAALMLSFCRKKEADGRCTTLTTVEDYRIHFRKHTFPLLGGYAGNPIYEGFGIIDVKNLEWV